MRIALDATPLSVSSGGITRYTAELGCALAAEFPQDEIRLVSDQPFAMPNDAPVNVRSGGPSPGWTKRRWWSAGIAVDTLRSGTELFHGTDFAVPYLPLCPSVMTVHDLSPWREGSIGTAASRRVRRRAPLLLGLGLATMVITPSENVRREVIEHFRVPAERVRAVRLAASAAFRPVPAPPPDRPYFLYLGVLEPRKNIPLLIEAWHEVRRRRQVDLVLAGRKRADAPAIIEEPGLQLTGEIPERELPALYSGAVALLYPSQYEGFGLPVLEAMSCGTPVITSRDPSIAEVVGEAAIRLDTSTPGAWTEAMIAMCDREQWRTEWRGRGIDRSKLFSWSRTARETREVYEEARRRFAV